MTEVEVLRCVHCTVKVVPIDAPGSEVKFIGKGEAPMWKHDLKDTESGPTCGRGALREDDIDHAIEAAD